MASDNKWLSELDFYILYMTTQLTLTLANTEVRSVYVTEGKANY